LAVAPDVVEAHLRSVLAGGYAPGSAADVVAGRPQTVHVTFDDAYRSLLAALPALERLGVEATVFACTGFAVDGAPLRIPELRDDVDAAPEEFATLRWDELRALSERGFEIGSHTITHAHLPRLTDAALERELVESRAQMEDELGLPCRYLAYPFGEHDARVRDAAKRAGYDAAFAVRTEAIGRWALPRIDLYWADAGWRYGSGG
jgi:peptidoglycan/xylan/chitin deacetylase (PgdA/CDA1 family)